MRLLRQSIFHGPNVYLRGPAICAVIDVGPFRNRPPGSLRPPFADSTARLFPGVFPAFDASADGADAGSWPLAIARVAIALQRSAGFAASSAARRRTGANEEAAVFDLSHPAFADTIAATALRIVRAIATSPAEGASEAHAIARDWRERNATHLPSVMAKALTSECDRRGIPWSLAHPHRRVIQLGHGHKMQRTVGNVTSQTPWLAGEVARDKALTNKLLADAGLPVTEQRAVKTVREGLAAARELGFPLVVKPNFGGKGLGVAPLLRTIEAVERALSAALAHGIMLVERHVEGDDHRLFVIDDRMVAAARKLPASVMGDGIATIRMLVERANADPLRGDTSASPLVRIELDDEARRALAEQGLDEASAPAAGARVLLRLNANLSTGGSAHDVTAHVHPDNAAAAVRAARIVGLDIIGIDFITPDISRSYREVGGAIIEVNGTPGVRLHAEGAAPPVVIRAIVDRMFPDGSDGRIPIAAITGSDGKTSTCHMVAGILHAAGHRVGLATTVGVRIDDVFVAAGDRAGTSGSRVVLGDPSVTAAVLECAHLGIFQRGLGFDRCDVGALLNIRGDHVGVDRIRSIEHLARIKALVPAVAHRLAVLNADDPLCVQQRSGTSAPICWATIRPDHPGVRRHVAEGGTAVMLSGQGERRRIDMWAAGHAVPIVDAADIPAAHDGTAQFNVENAMFAAAIAWGLAVPVDAIRSGLRRYGTDFRGPPLRIEPVPEAPFRLFLDFAHNATEVAAIARFATAQRVTGRRIIVMKSPGNRLEHHFDAIAAAAAGHFDLYVSTQNPDTARNRPDGEVQALLAAGLRKAGVASEQILLANDPREAIEMILPLSSPDDLVIVCCNDGAPVRAALRERRSGGTSPAS